MNRLYGKKYHNILSLMDLILSLPVSTAECERGFSWLKRTKTDWRANLGATSLNDLMCYLFANAHGRLPTIFFYIDSCSVHV